MSKKSKPKESAKRTVEIRGEDVDRLATLEAQLSRTKKALCEEREKLEPKMTLEDAFTYDGSDSYTSDAVKGVLAVSFLLDSISEIGGKNVDARIAQGLAYALRDIARDIDKLLTEKARLNEAEHALQEARGRKAAPDAQ